MAIRQVGGGPSAHFHLWILQALRVLLWPVGHRGFGKSIAVMGHIFPKGSYAEIAIGRTSTIRVDLDDAYWMGPLMKGSGYEAEVGAILDRFLDPTTAFIDCGANIGYWSILASERVSDPELVVAVEASPFLAERLRLNNRLNGNRFHIHHAAIWSHGGKKITLAADRAKHSWGSVAPAIASELVSQGFDAIEIPTVTLDEIAHRIRAQRFIVKVDVEGAESQAFEGARSLSEKEVLFIFEEHVRDISRAGARDLLARGFRLFAITDEGGPKEMTDAVHRPELPKGVEAWNLVACREGGSFAHEMGLWTSANETAS